MSRDMAAMTVADESLYALPLQRLNVFAASRDRQRRMPSDRGAVPSYFAATSTSGLDIERVYTCSATGMSWRRSGQGVGLLTWRSWVRFPIRALSGI